MVGRLWLMFAQTVTIGLALLFIVQVLRPEWLQPDRQVGTVTINETAAITRASSPVFKRSHADSYSDAVLKAAPAVVSIDINGDERPHDSFSDDPRQRRQQNRRLNEGQSERTLASGVIVSKDGYVLTNRHVIEGANEITVLLSDNRSAQATVVGSDAETDLAVLHIDLHDLPVITLGRIEEARVGDVVLAIGNPFNVGQTVTMGIISALGRNHLNLTNFENYIQTDAAINPGNSGGALVNASGNLIGINSAIFTKASGGSLGIGFAVPVSTAKEVLEGIITSGEVIRGYIGVEPQDIAPEEVEALTFGRSKGAFISGVNRGGPADLAGVKPGDILVAVNDHAIIDTITMLDAIARLKPGSNAKLKVFRRKEEIALSVKVGTRPKPGTSKDK
ncbi:MAG: trypsin-like peptidase domain-containing protein [Burkholderiaceae bacterium]